MRWLHLRALAATISAVWIGSLSLYAQSRALREPDWSDPGVVRAHASFQDQRRKGLITMSAPPGGRELSLPRWGFAKDIRKLEPNERSRARTPSKLTSSLKWPDCAVANPVIEHLRDETGVWYADDYDFGCVILLVRGDRAYDPNLKLPASTPRVNGCESGAGPSAQPSEEGDRQGRFDLQLLLNRIPYAISGQCYEGALEFCRNRAAQCALVDRLLYLEGSKQ